MSSNTPHTVTRFDLGQRIQHILLITSFTVLGLTGLPQSFSQTAWAQTYMSLLGGIDGIRRIHHLFAVLMSFVFIYHVIVVAVDFIFKRSTSMLPNLKDAKDVAQSVAYLSGRRAEKPQFDRFDFKQKIEYWALIWGTVLMGVTGLILMFPMLVTQYLPGEVIYAAKAAHGLEALLAIASIIVWHMYNTHFADGMWPADTTIFTGKISMERMKEEHPLEYQRLYPNPKPVSESGNSAEK